MYKLSAQLLENLIKNKTTIENDINTLTRAVNQGVPTDFDELQAARRINNAKSKDHMNGTTTAGDVISAVDTARVKREKDIEVISSSIANARKGLTLKKSELIAINEEIQAVSWKIGKRQTEPHSNIFKFDAS